MEATNSINRRRLLCTMQSGGTSIEYAAMLGLLTAVVIVAAAALIGSTSSLTQSVAKSFPAGSDGPAGRTADHLGDPGLGPKGVWITLDEDDRRQDQKRLAPDYGRRKASRTDASTRAPGP